MNDQSCICKDAVTSRFLVTKVECGQLLQPIRKSSSSHSEQVASLNGLAMVPAGRWLIITQEFSKCLLFIRAT